MKFTVPVACSSCGCNFAALGYGKSKFPPANCPECGEQIHIIDPLTISVVADRLVLRSQREMNEGDFTLSIICSTIAVECALTQVFLKWKGLDHFSSAGQQPTEIEQNAYEQEYKRKTSPGGFEKSADFVSAFLIGKKYDEFIADMLGENNKAELIKARFPRYGSQAKADYIHAKLFAKRNRIMHWGEVSYNKDDAFVGLTAASTAISVLKMMDHKKYIARERAWRSSTNNQS